MARRRMFSLDIIDTDFFLDLPCSSQNFYFHLAMRADDDGFVSSPKKIMKIVGCADDDYKVLIAKRFIIPFESGVCVIKHWKIHNYIQSDRYKETVYYEEKALIETKENGAYTECIQDVSRMETQVRLGKVSIGKDREDNKRFRKPTIEQIKKYVEENGYNIDAEKYFNHYDAQDWIRKNGQKISNWKNHIRAVKDWDYLKKKEEYTHIGIDWDKE